MKEGLGIEPVRLRMYWKKIRLSTVFQQMLGMGAASMASEVELQSKYIHTWHWTLAKIVTKLFLCPCRVTAVLFLL